MIRDSVNHPQHYTQGKYETIELIESIAGYGPQRCWERIENKNEFMEVEDEPPF